MSLSLPPRVQAVLEEQLGCRWQDVLAPVETRNPAGPWLRGSPLYQALQDARSADDASLPMGTWQHELKHADWPRVRQLAVEALCGQSKDLQVAVWLLEAQIQLQGLAGIAPGLWLIAGLLDTFWADLHPLPQGEDLSHRANLLRWVNRKLLAPLKLIPLTQASPEHQYAWADLEHAQRREQLRATNRRDAGEGFDPGVGPDLAALQAALAATAGPAVTAQHEALTEALAALAALNEVIDRSFSHDGPSLGHFTTVLQDMLAWVSAELRRRGLPTQRAAPPAPVAAPSPAEPRAAAPATGNAVSPEAMPPSAHREQAYAMLAAACETLLRIEPHSPVPYVVQRAIAWGSLNTAELYLELFVRTGGQINIFELLGIADGQPAAAASA